MQLTQQHIQQLYTFTQMHYVEYYDLQTELVDHLANGIEQQWETNPDLAFESALQIEFKKFGVCGFSDVVSEKTKALNKHYWLLIWNDFKSFFTIPKIILTLFLMWSYFQLLINAPNKAWVLVPSLIIILVFPLFKVYKSYKTIKKQQKKTQKKWMFEAISLSLGGMLHLFHIPLQIAFLVDLDNWGFWYSLIFSVFIIAFAITIYIALYIASPKLKTTMAKQYPDYKII